MKVIAENHIDDLLVFIGNLNSDEVIQINTTDLKLLKEAYEEETEESIINDSRLYNDYVETLANRLETTYNNASRLVSIDTMEEVVTKMYEAEVDHINLNIVHYEELFNHKRGA